MKATPRPMSLYPYVWEPWRCQPTPSYTPPSWPTRKLGAQGGRDSHSGQEDWLHSLPDSSTRSLSRLSTTRGLDVPDVPTCAETKEKHGHSP